MVPGAAVVSAKVRAVVVVPIWAATALPMVRKIL